MSTTKPSARTTKLSNPNVRSSERSVTDPTTGCPKPIKSASGRSSNGSHPTNRVPRSTPKASGGSPNGAQPTNLFAEPSANPSAAPTFDLRNSLREFLKANTGLTTRDEIINAYIQTLSSVEIKDALQIALRGLVYELSNLDRGISWRIAERNDEVDGPQSSSKWDEIRAAVEDGSLDRYRRIVDSEIFIDEHRTRFGSLTLTQLEAVIDLRHRQERHIRKARERLLRVHKQMRATGAETIDELDHAWLVNEWIGSKDA